MKKLTFKEIRSIFWNEIVTNEEKKEFRTRKKQNEYNCTIRSKFIYFIDSLEKNGEITKKQAENITL